LPVALSVFALGALWYGGECLLAGVAGWPISPLSPFFGLLRDLLLPVLFVSAFYGDDFVWRGNEMQVERLRPRGMTALAHAPEKLIPVFRKAHAQMQKRPRLVELAPRARRRLRSLRERMS
jgi:hypothetical protein